MKPERWQQIDSLLDAALELEGADRAAFLDDNCGGDEELRQEIESLLAAHEASKSFIETSALNVAARLLATDDETTLAAGDAIGHYEIRSLLGKGGMGEVYLATDTTLRRNVALKLLPADFTADKDRLARFEREAYAASSLNHPNILTIHEIGSDKGMNFIATEFIDGESLRVHLYKEPLELSEILEIGIQAASALTAAHAANIVHRDIKPENIMVRQDGIVKVLDFGLAKLIEQESPAFDTEAPTRVLQKTAPGMIIGTPHYMSPEQARGKDTDERTDVWSLGCVLYEMVARRTPFEDETVTDILAAIVKSPPAPLAQYRADTPAELERIVTKALEKNREERYQTAKDMLIDLRRLKRRLDAEAELERTAAPEGGTATGRSTRFALDAQREIRTITGNTPITIERRAAFATVPTISSAEYMVAEFKRHKLLAFVALAVFTFAISGVVYYLRAGNVAATGIDSIAVLPFENSNHDPDAEYLSDGLTESIINNLTQLPQLRVIARSTVFRYKGKETDPLIIGKELGVRAVLTGRVMQRGDDMAISVELVDVRDDKQLWGEQYSREISGALAVQKEISKEISERLRFKLSGAEQQQMEQRGTANPEAYQFYLKGRFYWNKRTGENLKKAIEQFQQAANKDPNYALANVGLSNCYMLLEEYTGTPSSETLPKAKAYAERALQIDNSLAEAHISLAFIQTNLWQWDAAERDFKQGIALNPDYPTAHQWYSFYLRSVGRLGDALAEDKRAHELDPLSLVINANLALGYLSKNDVDAAVEQSIKTIELDANHAQGYSVLGLAYLAQRRYAEALAELQKAVERSDRTSGILCLLGYANALAGNRAEALAIVKELEGKYARRQARGQDIAMVYTGLEDNDQAFIWLEKDFQVSSGGLAVIRWYPTFDALHIDSRYADLMRRMKLKP